ncbi:MAG: hypothetical protein LBE91_04950 [Tannerella sp.]|nr:hypothetical protein [Tannerella sp.]
MKKETDIKLFEEKKVKDASLTGCRKERLPYFLPSDVFLTEYNIRNNLPTDQTPIFNNLGL